MKNLLLLSIIVFVKCTVFGQSYTKFINENSIWGVSNECSGQSGYCLSQFPQERNVFVKYQFKGDTIISSIKYAKLYGQNLRNQYSLTNTCSTCQPYLSNLMREDTISKKVYSLAYKVKYKRGSDTSTFYSYTKNDTSLNYLSNQLFEILTYDFSLGAGDTFLYDGKTTSTVLSISMKTLGGGISRKVLAVNLNNQIDSIIEGIGSRKFLPFVIKTPQEISVQGIKIAGDDIYLKSFVSNNIVAFGNTGNYVVTEIHSSNAVEFSSEIIYPNPAKNVLYFKINDGDVELIQILDTQGKLHQSTSFQLNQPINIDSLHPGIYVVSFSGKKNWKSLFVKE